MTDFELFLACLLIPAAYVVIYICGKHDMLALICKMLERRWKEIEKEADCCEWKYNETEELWESSCEHLHIFMADGPVENMHEFCPYCGKPIKISEVE